MREESEVLEDGGDGALGRLDAVQHLASRVIVPDWLVVAADGQRGAVCRSHSVTYSPLDARGGCRILEPRSRCREAQIHFPDQSHAR